MKITIHPDGRIEREGTAEEMRAYEHKGVERLELVPMPTGQCICGWAFWSVVPPICPVHGPGFRYTVGLNAACQPWNMGQVWVGEIKAPMVTMFPPPGAAAACAPSWH